MERPTCAPLCGATKAYGTADRPWKHEPECPVRKAYMNGLFSKRYRPNLLDTMDDVRMELGYMVEQLTKYEVEGLAKLCLRYYDVGWHDAKAEENPPEAKS